MLFCCLANRARSPLAELAARDLLRQHDPEGELTVASAGIAARAGEPIWPPAEVESRHLGLDATSFRSQPVTSALVADSPLVLAATRAIRDHVIAMHPDAGARTFTWGEVAWLLRSVTPDWGDLPLAQRPGALAEFVVHYRGRVPAPPPGEVDVADPAGRPPAAMAQASRLTYRAVSVIVSALGSDLEPEPRPTTG